MSDTTIVRCKWCGSDPLYMRYHDCEWGVPVRDDQQLFAKLVLDGFQAGLAWITVLRKREAFECAFHDFDPHRVARFTDTDIQRLLANASIIRSRAKIAAAIKNARAWIQLREGPRGGDTAFSDLLWSHVAHRTLQPRFCSDSDIPAATAESEAMAVTLKKQGFSFCGPTICYAFMQAVGMTNDHIVNCHRHNALSPSV